MFRNGLFGKKIGDIVRSSVCCSVCGRILYRSWHVTCFHKGLLLPKLSKICKVLLITLSTLIFFTIFPTINGFNGSISPRMTFLARNHVYKINNRADKTFRNASEDLGHTNPSSKRLFWKIYFESNQNWLDGRMQFSVHLLSWTRVCSRDRKSYLGLRPRQ